MSEYTLAVSTIIPAVRASIAKELTNKHGMKEEKIADALGVAQAAVSKYLSSKYSKRIAVTEAKLDRNMIEAHSAKIAEGKREYVKACICTACMALNSFDCKFACKLQ